MVRVKLLGSLRELAGGEVEVEASSWREALLKLREEHEGLARVIDERGDPRPGYMVFVDGVDYRLLDPGERAEEVILLPIAHGGSRALFVTWEDVHRASMRVAESIESSGSEVEVIVGVLRGGVIPARLIADRLGVEDLGVLEVKFYTGPSERIERPYLRQPLTLDVKGRRVLVVDDVSDTGLTLQVALESVRLYQPEKVLTAALYVKPWTRLVPDFYSERTDKWIVFPWEEWEYRRKSGLVEEVLETGGGGS